MITSKRNLEEKPAKRSNYAVRVFISMIKTWFNTKGLNHPHVAKLNTDINKRYLSEGTLQVKVRKTRCLAGCGTRKAASGQLCASRCRQGMMISCVEEIAYRMALLKNGLIACAQETISNDYGQYLMRLANGFLNMKRILLFAKNVVGWELQQTLSSLGTMSRWTTGGWLFKPLSLRGLCVNTSPDVIVSPCAYTAVDKANEVDRRDNQPRRAIGHWGEAERANPTCTIPPTMFGGGE